MIMITWGWQQAWRSFSRGSSSVLRLCLSRAESLVPGSSFLSLVTMSLEISMCWRR